jgi:DNA polymerase I
MAKRLFLIDGSGLIFRAFFAIRHLSNREGHPTNATYGFIMQLRKVLADHNPSHIAVVFDSKEKTFRHEMYPEYKANRPEPPEELIPQFADIREVVAAHNLVGLAAPGFEADDIIGTLTERAVAEGFEDVVVVTSDKDLFQLVNDKVTLLDTMKDVVIDKAAVREKFGTTPEGVVDALGLMGDSSDNVPGAPGVGPKTARTLLEKYGNIQGIYEHLDEVKGKLKEKLGDNRELVDLSRRLVTIKKDVPLDVDFDDFAMPEPDDDALRELYERFGFTSLLQQINGPKVTLARDGYKLVTTEAELAEMIDTLTKAGKFAIDTETTAAEPMRAELVGASFCCDESVAYYVPVAHRYLGCPVQLSKETLIQALTPLLSDPALLKIGQNIKYDEIVLRNAGVEIADPKFDTMVAAYLLDSDRMSQSMDSLAREYLGHQCITYKEVVGKGKSQKTFDEVPLDLALPYAAEDAQVTWMLWEILAPKLAEENLEGLFNEMEMPLVGVLRDMEMSGVKIDTEFFAGLHDEYIVKIGRVEKEIHEMAGGPFNLNSPKQLGKVLFEDLGLKPIKKTKTGPSTDVTVLEKLAETHELPARMLQYRGLHKLLSTYIDTLPKLIHDKTGRIHGSFHQTVAATGRLSSSDPNLQNIPVRTEDGRRIREGFVPEDGKVLLSADYSQIELRVMAHLSGDEAMISHFISGEDIHRRTASEVFEIIPALVDKEQRSAAKAINFGILYGISAFRLGKDLGIGAKRAAQYIEQYFDRYPQVRTYLDEVVEKAREDGYVTTLFGRRRFLPQLQAKEAQTRAFGERAALNTPIQGTAADLIKMAMITLQRKILDEKLPMAMTLQVHDELMFEVEKDAAEAMMAIVVEQMENVAELVVPLVVDAQTGANWAVVH